MVLVLERLILVRRLVVLLIGMFRVREIRRLQQRIRYATWHRSRGPVARRRVGSVGREELRQ